MSSQVYRGRLKGKSVIVLEGEIPLPDDTYVLVTPMAPQPGTAEAILAAVRGEPHLTEDDWAEFEKILEEQHPTSKTKQQAKRPDNSEAR